LKHWFLMLFLTASSLTLRAQDKPPDDATASIAAAGASTAPSANGQNDKSMLKGKDATPPPDASHFQLMTGVGAVLAGAESTSYSTGNDAMVAKNVGRKTPEILLGGGFILPWRGAGGWIEREYCGTKDAEAANQSPSDDCKIGGTYRNYRPWQTFLSIRFAPGTDQTINGFVVGGGYRLTKYFSLLIGYSVTPVEEPSPGFRVAAASVVSANPTIAPYNRYNAADLLSNKPGAFDGFPLFVYGPNGVTTAKLFPNPPTVTHHRSGIYFGVGIPLDLKGLFTPK